MFKQMEVGFVLERISIGRMIVCKPSTTHPMELRVTQHVKKNEVKEKV